MTNKPHLESIYLRFLLSRDQFPTLRRKARLSGFLTCQLVQSLHKMKSLFASVLVFAFCIFVGKFYMCPDIQLLYFDLGYFNTDNSSWVIQYHYVFNYCTSAHYHFLDIQQSITLLKRNTPFPLSWLGKDNFQTPSLCIFSNHRLLFLWDYSL